MRHILPCWSLLVVLMGAVLLASLGDPNGHVDQARPDGATAKADTDGGA